MPGFGSPGGGFSGSGGIPRTTGIPVVPSFSVPVRGRGQNPISYGQGAILPVTVRQVGPAFADVGLNFNLNPNTSYYFRFFLRIWSDTTTTGVRLALNGPAGATFRAGAYIANATATADNGVVTAYETAFVATTAGQAAGTELPAWVEGWIDVGATGGKFSLRFASEVIGPGAVFIGAGSFGTLSVSDSRICVCSADTTNSSTTSVLADAPGMSFAVNNSTRYVYRFVVFYSTDATTTGARFAINGPSGTVRVGSLQPNGVAGMDCGTAAAVETIICAATTGPGATVVIGIVEGYIQTTANGTLQLRFVGENVASATMTVYQRSFGEIYVVA